MFQTGTVHRKKAIEFRAFAKHQFDLAKSPEGSSTAKSKHLKQVEKTTGRKFDTGPKCPEELTYLWEWFAEIYQFEPLTFTEIKAWSDLTGKNIQSWEATLISSVSRFV